MKFSSFDEACSYIESCTNLAKLDNYTVRTYRLDRMVALLDHFDHPERHFKAIHVAGSKGKGSTAAYLAKGLTALGLKTGLYTSPHVTTYRERFTISGLFFEDHFLLSTANAMISHLEDFVFHEDYGYSSATTFELLTLLGFLLFAGSDCEYAVIETGLGGRLDATNVITPIMSVITPIELEHTAVLGDTISKIATEKAGIIKPQVPVCTARLLPDAMAAVTKRAQEVHSPVHAIPEYLLQATSHTAHTGEIADLQWKDGTRDHLVLSMPGSFQTENAALAILVLRKLGLFDASNSLPAIERAVIPGRMELIREAPSIYVDGAHTEHSLLRVFSSFREMYPSGGILIFGSVSGKNHEKMAKIAVSHFDVIIISRPGTFKQSDPQALYELFMQEVSQAASRQHKTVLLIEDPAKALEEAVSRCKAAGEAILTAGSFYMAAEIRQVVCENPSI
ncbi:MAG: bifunctional folylpolyglutamate synthase/dihydrofolate synthase [Spirochaetota bacterium]